MAKKKHAESGGGGESGTGRWMLTYLDMITLLFGVFVIMYAMSNVDKGKAEQVSESLRAAFAGGFTFYGGPLPGGNTPLNDLHAPGTKRRGLNENVRYLLRREIRRDVVIVTETERGLRISFYDDVFFESGSARITDEMLAVLAKIVPVLKEANYYIVIAGNTDDVPVGMRKQEPGEYTDNWELAALRAINVLRFFEEKGVEPAKMSAASYGKYQPVGALLQFPGKDTPEFRSLNRRVDVIIETGRKFRRTGAANRTEGE